MIGPPMSGQIKVLDHGYVEEIDVWGSDERIIEAARMSTQKGFEGWGDPDVEKCSRCPAEKVRGSPAHVMEPGHCDPWAHDWKPKVGDEKLLAFLWKNNHATPFEMAGMTIEVQAPIFVFREWHRHRTQSYNEMSARYAPLPDVNYVPTVERLLTNSKSNKQAGTIAGAHQLDEAGAEAFIKQLEAVYRHAEATYQYALADGVPKELARLVLPVGRYSRMRASANLRNWLGFLTLRTAPNAQLEIQAFANAVASIVARNFPRTHALWAAGVAA